MNSSRWRRFAFFEKHALSIPSEIHNSLIPSSSKDHSAVNSAENSKLWDTVSLVVSTASLPLKSKPPPSHAAATGTTITHHPKESADVVTQFWSTLNACSTPELPSDATTAGSTVTLPSQSQSLSERELGLDALSEDALDGLVLVFATSQATGWVHCFDVTVRCNPPDTNGHLEELDGWRGYFAPFSLASSNDRDALSSSPSSSSSLATDGIIALATCRSNQGHGPLHLACISKQSCVVWEDPHLHLSCRLPLTAPRQTEGTRYSFEFWNSSKDGSPSAVGIVPGIMAVGTDTGAVLICTYGSNTKSNANSRNSDGTNKQNISVYLRIPPPPAPMSVVSVKISKGKGTSNQSEGRVSVFVAYRRSKESQTGSAAGICCYDMPTPSPTSTSISAPSARHDLDGRHVAMSGLCDAVATEEGFFFTVARSDGLYTYSQTQKIGVAPIDGTKLSICVVPPPVQMAGARDFTYGSFGSNYTLVASTDSKSDRDAVDVYDSTNKLVAFHLLLSPGHRAVKSAGVTTSPARTADGRLRGGQSSSVVLTSGGSLISFTEKATSEKVNLLVQKNLFSAAVAVAYSDPSLEPSSITTLYRKYAEHLYRKGEYGASVEQYINTIGMLEPSHVCFRFLDAPKIQYLVTYLEELRSRKLATPVHCELLRTCYLKLNDSEAAESIAASKSVAMDKDSLGTLLSTLSSNPQEALARVCTLAASEAAEVLVAHGAAMARVMPRETAGIVISLCIGTYSPAALADAATAVVTEANKMLEQAVDERDKPCEPFPVRLFHSAFLDNPKMLRLILAHCNRNKCHLTPSLRRTLLELTLAEWEANTRSGDTEGAKLRHREAIAALTDSHCHEIGDNDALVIVQQAGFDEGELLLYERLQMGPMLLSRYAHDGSAKSRRQMLAMAQASPDILAASLGFFVAAVSSSEKQSAEDDDSEDGTAEILDDIQEALAVARLQGKIAPVRIARILSGEGTERFSADLPSGESKSGGQQTVPLFVALEYVGAILDESRKEISRLKSEVQEYNSMCNSMEAEVSLLLRASQHVGVIQGSSEKTTRTNIDEVYSKVRTSVESNDRQAGRGEQSREAFWREMHQSEDSFETISRFFAKGVMQ